jgi:hypothetical protein
MRWLDIKAVKQEIRAAPEQCSFKYFLGTLVSYSVSYLPLFQPKAKPSVHDWIRGLIYFVIIVAGTIHCHRANGGHRGKHFLQRFFPVAWVMGWRYGFLGAFIWLVWLLAIVPFFSVVGLEDQKTLQRAVLTALMAVCLVLMYYRIGGHLRDLANSDNT